MHDNQNPTPESDPTPTPGRHRPSPDTTHVGCFIKVYPFKAGLRVHTPHDGSQNRAVAS
ncbi:hypothetical protein [Lentzea guizhouensis]|uniref:hypothetical protein n=1 Tax=Lentzea guizhouensis TaxID=1586287 RepID=UPI0012B68DF4|nr:hypothetical protein [Lentzea guizhouensis]